MLKVFRLFTILENTMGVGMLLIILFDVTLGIVFRYIDITLAWVIDVSKYALAGLTFIGISIGIREQTHPSFTAIVIKLSPTNQIYAKIFQWLCWLIGLGILFWLGWSVLYSYIEQGMIEASLKINKFWLRLPFLIGIIFSFLRVIQKIIEYILIIKNKKLKEPT